MKRVTNGFAKLALANFTQTLQVIVANMTNNAYFNNLQTEVTALKTAADDFAVLVVKASKRDQDAILLRDTKRAAITDMLHNLGMDVTAVAKGDENILSSSGFPFTKPKQTTPPMVKPPTPIVKLGVNNGQIDCRTSSQMGMKSVNYYITSDSAALAATGADAWNIISYNKTKFTFSDLTSGQRYYIKVGLVGVRGQEVISDAVSYIAQ